MKSRYQSRAYEKQIRAIDKYLLLKAEQDKILSEFDEDEEVPTLSPNPIPTTTFFDNPKLKKLRSRFNNRKKFL